MTNVDFQNKNLYHLFRNESNHGAADFRRIGQNVVFDGCNHAIFNINGALCKECAGEIKNLAIRQAKITFPENVNPETSMPISGGSETVNAREIAESYDYIAGIFGSVTGTGLNNILVEGIDVDIKINADEGDDNEGKTWVIGALAGKVVNVTNIHLRGMKTDASENGNISVSVTAADKKDSHFTVGGVFGMDDTGADIRGYVDRYVSSVSTDDAAAYASPKINVTVSVGSGLNEDDVKYENNVTNELRVGGFMGQFAGNWADISLASCQVTVDCQNSIGKFLYAGCFAGDIERSATGDMRAGIDNVSISGSVINGKGISPDLNGNRYFGRVYTGGFAGHVSGYDMSDCVFSGNVRAGRRLDFNDTYTRISTGGLIGGIADNRRGEEENEDVRKNELSHIYNCTAFAAMTVNEDFANTAQSNGARYYAGSCVGLQNFPHQDYNDDKDKTYVPFPSRSAKPSDLTNEENVYYAEQTLPQIESCLLVFADEKQGWYPVNPSYGNMNRTSNPKRPFCGAYMDDTEPFAGGGRR